MKTIKFSDINYYESLVKEKNRTYDSFILIDGKELSISPAKITKAAKMIAALANSGGGHIIYGIASKYKRADKIAPVKEFNKSDSWIINEIQSHIDKPVKDLELKISPVNDYSNGLILHFFIPINNEQPHMFADNKYYKIKKNKAYVLDESEVRVLYDKLSHCELEFLGIYNTNGLPVLSNGKFNSISFYPKILIRNSGNMVEKDYKIEIAFPAVLFEENYQPLKALFIRHEGSYAVFGQKGLSPIFQEEINTMIEAKIAVSQENVDVFVKEFLIIKLYYSNGIKSHKIKLSETLTYNGKKINPNDFKPNKKISN